MGTKWQQEAKCTVTQNGNRWELGVSRVTPLCIIDPQQALDPCTILTFGPHCTNPVNDSSSTHNLKTCKDFQRITFNSSTPADWITGSILHPCWTYRRDSKWQLKGVVLFFGLNLTQTEGSIFERKMVGFVAESEGLPTIGRRFRLMLVWRTTDNQTIHGSFRGLGYSILDTYDVGCCGKPEKNVFSGQLETKMCGLVLWFHPNQDGFIPFSSRLDLKTWLWRKCCSLKFNIGPFLLET